MAAALDVARHLLDLAASEPVAETLTNRRLQALLFYAQGWHLGSFDYPLFADPVVLTPNGPAVAGVSQAVIESVGDDPTRVIRPGELGPCALAFRERQFVTAIWEKYRRLSAAGLREQLRDERPWVASGVGSLDDGAEVPHAALRHYFLRRDELRGFDPTEWERATEGEEQIERGEGIPWDEVKRQLRERALPTRPVANGLAATPGGPTLPAG